MTEVRIITDGACSGNPGPGGWACILQCRNGELIVSGNSRETTNNRMELQAVLIGLQSLQRPCAVTIESDSAYIVNQANGGYIRKWGENGWRNASNQPVKNRDLWEMIAKEMKKHNVTFKKVKGHAGHIDNERADKEACVLRDMAKAGNFVSFRKTLTKRDAK